MKLFNIVLIISLITTYFTNISFAQIGGTATYRFLDLPNSAKAAALGGNNITLNTNDINLIHNNPALLNPDMDNNFSINYVPYFADINWGYVAYAKKMKNFGTLAAGIHYINYGEFIEADEYGNKTGKFTAAEYAADIVWSKKIDSLWSFGLNFKPIYSVLERYTSFGVAVDLGILYYKPSKLFSAALVIKNIGTQIKPYYKGHYEKIPFDIQFGITKKLEHAPFRISFVAQHLQKPNLNYQIPENQEIIFDSETQTSKESWYIKYPEMALRHCIFGMEFIPIQNFNINIGYNFQRRQEMKLQSKTGFTGFSWGIGIYVKKFQFEYGHSTFSVAGSSNIFSIKVNLNEFITKK